VADSIRVTVISSGLIFSSTMRHIAFSDVRCQQHEIDDTSLHEVICHVISLFREDP
jgi:hypothetical protein